MSTSLLPVKTQCPKAWLLALSLVGCSSGQPPDLQVALGEPQYTVMRSGPADRATTAIASLEDGTHGWLYISSDHGGDIVGSESDKRLSLDLGIGGARKMGEGAALLYRDRELNMDCSDFVGFAYWTDGNRQIQVNAYCRADHALAVVGTLSGAYVEWLGGVGPLPSGLAQQVVTQ